MPDAEVVSQESVTSKQQSSPLVKLLYNHNPFYLISAGVVLYGVHTTSQQGGAMITDPWLLAGIFTGYISLLAITSFLIVRFGRVWDDARSIFMVLLLLFFALSVSFDGLCIGAPSTATLMLTSGFAFCVLVTEAILWSLKIRLSVLYRIPIYLMLGVSFLFPLVFAYKPSFFNWVDNRWLLMGFSFVAGFAVLSLLPAVQFGRGLASDNGTPWSWPMFPFAAIVLLLTGLCGRSVLLCMAFDPSVGTGTIFGAYLLVPIAIACLIVMIEIGIVERNSVLQSLGIWSLPLTLLLAVDWGAGPGSAQSVFRHEFVSMFASPLWLTLIAVVVLLGLSWFRRVQDADSLFVCALAGSLFLQPDGKLIENLLDVSVPSCFAIAWLMLRTTERREQSGNWMMAAVAVMPVVSRVASMHGHPELSWVVAGNWLLFAFTIVAFAFADRLALQLRLLLAMAIPLLAVGGLGASVPKAEVRELSIGYSAFLGLFAFIVYFYSSDRLFLLASTLCFALLGIGFASRFRGHLAIDLSGILGFLVAGFVCFAVGVFVSCLKAGLANRLNKQIAGLKHELNQRFRVFVLEDTATND